MNITQIPVAHSLIKPDRCFVFLGGEMVRRSIATAPGMIVYMSHHLFSDTLSSVFRCYT